MATISKEIYAHKAMGVVGALFFFVVISFIANDKVCAQDFDYTSCIPYVVSRDGWEPADTVVDGTDSDGDGVLNRKINMEIQNILINMLPRI